MKTNVESFEDVIFENRNKEYGAYELRRKYSKRGSIAMIIALVLVSFAVGVPLIAGILNKVDPNYGFHFIGGIEISKIPKDKPEIDLSETPPAPVKPKEFIFIVPKIVNEITDTSNVFESIDILSEIANSGVSDTSTRFVITEKPQDIAFIEDPEPKQIFEITEKPLFPGGDLELRKYIAANTNYPVAAQEQGIEGTVYIKFVVSKSGEVLNAFVYRAVDPMLDEEALRVVKTIPKWKPGKNNGNLVNVYFIIPVKFQLQ